MMQTTRKKTLALLMALVMVLSLLPMPVFAEEAGTEAAGATSVAQLGTQEYATLQEAIDQAQPGDTVTLTAAATENVTIGTDLTLDLGGQTLTNAGSGAVTLAVKAGATVTVENGTILGGAGNYNIAVGTEAAPGASLTLRNVTATAGNAGSSMIDNWGTLHIESGTYTGGLNVVKSEERSTLTIDGGTFTLTDLTGAGYGYVGTILNYGTATINDGTFVQAATTPMWRYPQVVVNGQAGENVSSLTVTGGSFTNKYSTNGKIFHHLTPAPAESIRVSGGTFNKEVSSFYLNDGFSTKLVNKVYTIVSAVTGVTLDKTVLNLTGGESYKLTATLTPEEAVDQRVTWHSSDTAIATVSAGRVTAKKAGTVTITATPIGQGSTPATCTVNIVDGEAAVGTTQYPTLAKAVAAAGKGKTVKLLRDVDLDQVLKISKKLTLDLNGHTLYNSQNLWDTDSNDWSLISVQKGGDLTITGNGTLKAKENDCYALDTQDETAKLTIESGNIIGNISAIYVCPGTVTITGGSYSIQQLNNAQDPYNLTINCYDADYRDGAAKISISGGTFDHFDPANNLAEGKGTNFLATGYTTVKDGERYVVKATTAQTIDDLDAAIETISTSTSSAKKKAAAEVIKNIDNEDLAASSAAMDKLEALDSALTDSTSGTAKVTVTTESSVSEIAPESVTVTNAALSADLSSTRQQNVTITIDPYNADESVIAAAKEAAGAEEANVQSLEIAMKVGSQTVETPTAPVVLEFPLPDGWKGCQIVCVKDPANPELIPTTVMGGTVKATFNHFSPYISVQSAAVANPNKYQIELTPTEGQTKVYAGDTITFDVVLKRTEGDADTISTVRFTPASTMLTVESATAETGFTYDDTLKQFTHLDAAAPVALTNGQVKLGTLTCKVSNNGLTRQYLTVTAGEQDTVTVSGYQTSNGLTVAELSAEYDTIRVYFTNYRGTLNSSGGETTELKTFYTSAGSKELYASLDDLAAGTPAAAPAAKDGSITGGTQYRLTQTDAAKNLENWIAADGATKYQDLVAESGSGFTGTTSFYVSRVQLLEVADPEAITIVTDTTLRDSKTYTDKNADFTFTVPAAGTGLKNQVTVRVGASEVPAAPDATVENQYTVDASYMNDSPVTVTVTQVIDLDAADIKVFSDGAGSFLRYSMYSGTDTLVLIKGRDGAKYTLNPAAGTEAPVIYALPEGHGYGDYTLAVLIPQPDAALGVTSEAMLRYLTDTYHIAVEAGANTSVGTYDFDTNGDGNGSGTFKMDDVQATYDFSALAASVLRWEPTDIQLLKADVLTYANAEGQYNTPRDGQVTASDVDAFLYTYVYTPANRPSNP